MSRLKAPAAGKACYARLYSYSMLKKREPLIARGVLNFCARSTPTAGAIHTGNTQTNHTINNTLIIFF